MSTKQLSSAILSISLLTVMAGAAIAPALSVIKSRFSGSPDLLVQFIISLPALFIILSNLCFPLISKHFKTRTIALAGLMVYVVCGTAPFFTESLGLILVFRALLGLAVGVIMPLSTGLLAFYFPPQKQASLMGLSAAMNQLGGVVATLLAGLLSNISWQYTFLVYLLGLIAVLLVALFLPNEKLPSPARSKDSSGSFLSRLKHFHQSVVGMFLCMSLFFVFPSNFALTTHARTNLSANAVTYIMVGLDVVAFVAGLSFGSLMKSFRRQMKYFAPVLFILGYGCYCLPASLPSIIIGSILIGLANGVGVPYLNTIASIKGGKDAATTVMPLISAALYLGQFLSPIFISSLGRAVFGGTVVAPYVMAVLFGFIYLLQTFCTRHFQMLPPPPEEEK